jgi:large subunit ribosomal protein L28
MAKVCELTGVRVMAGNNVSKAVNRTKRDFVPNLKEITFRSDVLGSNVTLRVTANALRTVNKYGSFDSFLINYRFARLTDTARKIRHKVESKLIKDNRFDEIKIIKKAKAKKVIVRKVEAKKVKK